MSDERSAGAGRLEARLARTQQALVRSEERFRLLVEGVTDYAIFMLDEDGNVASWNAGAERIKGWSADEILGRHFSILYPPEDVARGRCELELAGARELGRFEDTGWRVRRDGSRFWANVVISAMRDGAGRIVGFSKVTRDLTLAKAAEETRIALAAEQAGRRESERQAEAREALVRELAAANARLEETVRARDDFLTVASHELKSPLNTLGLQLASSLRAGRQQDGVPGRLRARLESAQGEVRRLTRLIDGLLDVSRITANRLEIEPEDADLARVTRQVLERDRDEIEASGSEVSLDAPAELPGRWDRLRLDQILTNLLSNALKYGERKPISVRLEAVGERVRIVVRDGGLGIDAADQCRIFERFERAVSSHNYSGFGLGLWIVRQVVEAMGGTILLASEPGHGSTFTVVLPRSVAGSPS